MLRLREVNQRTKSQSQMTSRVRTWIWVFSSNEDRIIKAYCVLALSKVFFEFAGENENKGREEER